MISINDTHPAPKAAPSYRVRTEAMNAAVATIGPHARHGFEYTTTKCDGRWVWKPTDDVPAPTAAEIKASGGRRAFLGAASRGKAQQGGAGQGKPGLGGEAAMPPHVSLTAMATAITEGTPMADPNRLPVPPRRTLGKAAGASEGVKATGQPPAPETLPVPSLEAGGGVGPADYDPFNTFDTPPACNGLDVAPQHELDSMRKTEGNGDPLAIPGFLKREATPEAKEQAEKAMKRIAKQVGPDRTIKNPPDATAAVKRAEKAKAALAKVEGTPEHAKAKRAAKALDGAKPAKATTAAKAKNPASEARTRTAGRTIGSVATTAILKGKSNDEALAAVMKEFPDCSSNLGCMNWYRNKAKKTGLLRQDGTTSAKGEAFLAGPTKAA